MSPFTAAGMLLDLKPSIDPSYVSGIPSFVVFYVPLPAGVREYAGWFVAFLLGFVIARLGKRKAKKER